MSVELQNAVDEIDELCKAWESRAKALRRLPRELFTNSEDGNCFASIYEDCVESLRHVLEDMPSTSTVDEEG